MNRTLVIFDIDGTLLDTAGLHHDLVKAVLAVDGLDVTFQPWGSYRNYTDYGVLDELFHHAKGRPITAEELARYDGLYEAALTEWLAANELAEIGRAKALLGELADLDGVSMAFATGSLRRMAGRKLGRLGLDAGSVALASGGDHLTRAGIVRDAAAQATRMFGPFGAVVILGDGRWDQVTADELGIPFVAVESGQHVFDDRPILTLSDFNDLTGAELVALAGPVSGLVDDRKGAVA